MDKKLSIIILVVTILLVSLLVTNSILYTERTYLKPVSIAVSKTPLSAPFYIAQKLNYFESNGLDVEIIEVIGGKKSFNAVMNNQADYGTSSDSVLMFGGLNGNKYSNLSSFVESDNDIKLILNLEDGSSVNELKGKKVGVIKGSASEYFLSLLLEINRLKITDVELVQISPDKMLNAIDTRKVSAIATWEPYAFEIKKELGEKVKILNTKSLYTLTFNLISKKKDGTENNKQNIKLLRALDKAIIFINTNPIKAKKILMENLNLQEDFIDWVWLDYIYTLSLNRSLLLTIEDEARWAVQSGLAQSSIVPDYKSFIDPRALLEVDSRAVSF